MQADGRPVSGAIVSLSKKDDPVAAKSVSVTDAIMSHYSSTTDAEGHWSIHNLPDGSYLMHIAPKLNVPGQESTSKFVEKRKEVTIAGNDLADVLIEVSKGASISGTVIVEGDQPIFSLSLHASKLGQGFESSQTANASVRPAGRITPFVLTEVPEGEIELSAFVRPDSFYIKSIEGNGLDLLQDKLTIADGAELKDIRVVISPDVANLSGRVISANGGTLLPGLRVMLIPIRSDNRRMLGGRLTGETDSQGNFSVTPPPGEYRVELRRFTRNPPSISKPLLDDSPHVMLQPGEHKNIEIRVP